MPAPIPLRTLIDSHPPGWLADFETQISVLREQWSDASVFGLFDCVFNERCHVHIKKSGLDARCLYDLSNTPSPELQAVSPALVPLTRATAPSWREAVRQTDGYPMLSVIATPESLDELAQRLHPWCIVNADGEPYVFRFPDTRRLPAIVDVLTPEQHAAFFGPAHAWLMRTRSAKWARLPLPASSLRPADEVRLDAKQFVQLMGDAEADEIVAHFHAHEPALVEAYRPAEVHACMAHGLKRADHYGIEHSDRLRWCRLFVQRPLLETMPEAISLLTALKSKQCGFGEIEGPLTDLLARAPSP